MAEDPNNPFWYPSVSQVSIKEALYKHIDEASPEITYVGESNGTGNTAVAEWRIKRIQTLGSATIISFADAVKTATKIWDDRATYTY
jgi:hypothetical protein